MVLPIKFSVKFNIKIPYDQRRWRAKNHDRTTNVHTHIPDPTILALASDAPRDNSRAVPTTESCTHDSLLFPMQPKPRRNSVDTRGACIAVFPLSYLTVPSTSAIFQTIYYLLNGDYSGIFHLRISTCQFVTRCTYEVPSGINSPSDFIVLTFLVFYIPAGISDLENVLYSLERSKS